MTTVLNETTASDRVSRLVYRPVKQVEKRVPGLPIRDCTRSSNNRGPKWPKLSAIDVTAKTFFECLYLVSGLAPICALSQLSVCSHTPTVYSVANSRFPCKVAPQFFGQHDSPSNLTESRYPRGKLSGTVSWVLSNQVGFSKPKKRKKERKCVRMCSSRC